MVNDRVLLRLNITLQCGCRRRYFHIEMTKRAMGPTLPTLTLTKIPLDWGQVPKFLCWHGRNNDEVFGWRFTYHFVDPTVILRSRRWENGDRLNCAWLVESVEGTAVISFGILVNLGGWLCNFTGLCGFILEKFF